MASEKKSSIQIGDIVHPLFEIDTDQFKVSKKDWYIVKQAHESERLITLSDVIDNGSTVELTPEYLDDNFVPVDIQVTNLGEEEILLCQMVAEKIVEYAKKNVDDNKFFDNINGFISVIEDNVDLNTLHKCLCEKMDKPIADEIIMRRKKDRASQGADDVPVVHDVVNENIIKTEPMAQVPAITNMPLSINASVEKNPEKIAELFIDGKIEDVKASIGNDEKLYNETLEVLACNKQDHFKLAMAQTMAIKKDAAIKTAKVDEYISIDILDQNHLLVKVAYEGLIRVGLDKFIVGRSMGDVGHFRMADYSQAERYIGGIVKSVYPNCWIKLFGSPNLTKEFELQMPVSVSNMNDRDSFTKTDYRNIWASKDGTDKKAVAPKSPEFLPEKMDADTMPTNELMESFAKYEATLKFSIDTLKNAEEEAKNKYTERLLKEWESGEWMKEEKKHFDKSIPITVTTITDVVNILKKQEESVVGVHIQVTKVAGDEIHSKKDWKKFIPNYEDLVQTLVKADPKIKLAVDSVIEQQKKTWESIEDNITHAKDSIRVTPRAYEPSSKQSSLKISADVWQTIKNFGIKIMNSINYFISFLFHKKVEIKHICDDVQMELNQVSEAI